MSNQLLAKWHAYMENPSAEALSEMLHDDVTFISPVVFTPQKGKELAMKYLLSAGIVFKDTKFEYVHEIETENRMILEFEAEMDGKYVNGVDIVDFDDDGLHHPIQSHGASFASGQYAVAANGRAVGASIRLMIATNGETACLNRRLKPNISMCAVKAGWCWIMCR